MLGVVFGHTIDYRFGSEVQAHEHLRYLGRLAGPFSELGVKLFFVISGYIITILLLKEEETTGGANIAAFYARRVFRILPPFLLYLACVLVFAAAGMIAVPISDVAVSAAFLCNTNITDCDWFVAHTWSLAVEEQFYLFWPLMLALIAPMRRKIFLAFLMLGLLVAFLLLPDQYHSNFSSFPCIAAGALYGLSGRLKTAIERNASGVAWLLVASVFVAGQLSPASKWFEAATPLALLYLIFSAYRIKWITIALESWPLQMVGLGSYSLYLWQQVFLAKPERYLLGAPSLWLLPIVVISSVMLVEKPFVRMGRKASSYLSAGPLRHRSA